MATCYRHPSRETAVSCSSCGRPICPDCMTPTPVGMRCPECSSQRTRVVRMRDTAAVPRVTYTLIALNVLAFLTEKGQFTINGSGIYGTVVNEGCPLPRRDLRSPPVLPPGDERLPARRPAAHRLQHVPAVPLGMMLEPAIGSVRFAAIYFTSLLCGSCGALVATGGPASEPLGRSSASWAPPRSSCARGEPHVMRSGIGFLIVFNLLFSFTFPNISSAPTSAG